MSHRKTDFYDDSEERLEDFAKKCSITYLGFIRTPLVAELKIKCRESVVEYLELNSIITITLF